MRPKPELQYTNEVEGIMCNSLSFCNIKPVTMSSTCVAMSLSGGLVISNVTGLCPTLAKDLYVMCCWLIAQIS